MASSIERLYQGIQRSRKDLEVFRRNRLVALKQYIGSHYSTRGADDRVPIQFLGLAIQIISRQLAARSPQVLVTTEYQELRPYCETLAMALNHLLKEIRFGRTINKAVVDALFSIGVAKVGLNASKTIEIGGVTHDVGQPFADLVDLDDWVHDTNARDIEECGFLGNRYWMPYEQAMDSGLFDKKVVEIAKGDGLHNFNEQGDERAVTLTRENRTGREDFRDYVEFWDIWIPDEGRVVTLTSLLEGKQAREVEWEGPELGPYHLLMFNHVPSNLMPLAPVAHWIDLHELANKLFVKIARDGERFKRVPTFKDPEDMQRFILASSGEATHIADAKSIGEAQTGGVDPNILAFVIQLKDMASYFGGNWDALGGLGPQADTLGQEQIIAASANQQIADLGDKVADFTRSIVGDLGFYLHNDPLIRIPLTKRMPELDLEIPIEYSPDSREGDYLQYNIDIEPVSMQHQTPSMRIAGVDRYINSMSQLAALSPMLAEQGVTIDYNAAKRFFAGNLNVPEINEIFVSAMPDPMAQKPPVGEAAPKPAMTKRTYERVNRPGATRQGKDQSLVSSLLGEKLQSAQRNQMTRPVS